MLKKQTLEKILAMILVFTLTFSNFAFVTKSYASTIAEMIFNAESKDTGHKNVEFDAYFETEDGNITSVISDVNNQELAINAKLDIKESGYLKDAKIEVKEIEEGKGLNFKVKELENLPETVETFEENVLKLNQLDSFTETVNLIIPIEYKYEKYYSEENLSKDVLIVLSGNYIDNEGEENKIYKEVKLNVSWKDERIAKVETKTTKYIDYGNGVILQTLVKVDSTTDAKTLPVKETVLTIEAPTITGALPTKIDVEANSTVGTNGKNVGETNFTIENWNYNQETNKITITTKNEKQLVVVNEFEDEFLKEEKEIKEERYYNIPGVDEYLITYTYENIKISEELDHSNSNIDAKITTFSGVKQEGNVNETNIQNNFEYVLGSSVGEMVSLSIENETKEVSKAYLYANYKHSEKYEIELKSKMMINVSYKEIIETLNVEDTENLYTDDLGNTYQNDDIYYKQIVVAKENFTKMLGETGEIIISDLAGAEIARINNASTVDENGNIVINLDRKISKLKYQTTKPVIEGSLVIGTVKVIKNSSIQKQDLVNSKNIVTKTSLNAKYDYVEELQNIETAECITKMLDTTTKATLFMSKDNLSTITMNENVEFKIELNNATDKSDLYGKSIFDIELPETVESIKLVDESIESVLRYAEGLEVKSVEIIDRTIRITVDGTQDGINTGVLSNGANIVVTANIKVNPFTPAKNGIIKLKYTNSEATNYYNSGNAELEFKYSAPTGLVALTTISNYNNNGDTIMSIGEGTREGILDVYSPNTRIAKNEIIIMNNNENSISNVAILGRIPAINVKDLVTETNLKTTLDTKLTSRLIADENNKEQFAIYYSSKIDATKDLEDANNGWTLNPENMNEMKSYLLVPTTANYEMPQAEVFKFSYEYEIPANLSHNEYFYGVYGVYFINNLKYTEPKEEIVVSDLVGLSTGIGPELELEIVNDKKEVKEFENFETKIIIKNIGQNNAEEIKAEVKIPSSIEYIECTNITEKVTIKQENGVIIAEMPGLLAGNAMEFTMRLNQKEMLENDVIIDEEIIIEDETVGTPELNNENKIEVNLTAKDLRTIITKTETIKVIEAELKIEEENNNTLNNKLGVQLPGGELTFTILVKNLKNESIKNVVVTKELPKEFDYIEGYAIGINRETGFSEKREISNFDENTRIVKWEIPELESNENKQLALKIRINEMTDDKTKADVKTSTKATADGISTYESNEVVTTIGIPVLRVTQTSDVEDTYIKEGNKINYQYKIRNEGGATAYEVIFTNNIPDGIKVSKITYTIGNYTDTVKSYKDDKAIIRVNIPAEEEMIVNVLAVAESLNGAQEKTITNYATISGKEVDEFETDKITHIVKISDKKLSAGETYESTQKPTINSSDNIVKTYKVTGIAWQDTNKDGIRTADEQVLTGISAILVNSDTGMIKQTATTDTSGRYTFPGVENGNYLVIFDYDTVKYTVTSYQKAGVAGDVNSDAFITEIEQNGKIRTTAITEVITVLNGNVTGLDIGLVLADKFDLELTKTITKVTKQMPGKTLDVKEYDNLSMVKTEFPAKNVAGSTVYVEYAITVANKGEITGYAKKIIDYVPADMVFNSSLDANANWYTGTDGNLYNEELAKIELAPGQSKTLKLVLVRQMTEDNTNIIHNVAEIYNAYNIYGVSDYNSTPGNNAQNENDQDSADLAVMIKTGETFIHISVIAAIAVVGSVVGVIVGKQIVLRKKKGGA